MADVPEVKLNQDVAYTDPKMLGEGYSASMPTAKEALECYLSIAQAIAGQTDYDLVLENFANRLRALIAHDHLDIVLLHPTGTQICYEAGLQTAWSHTQNPIKPTAESPIRDVLRGRKDAGQIDETQFDEIETIIEGEENT